jgi:Amt family ammonium transporter
MGVAYAQDTPPAAAPSAVTSTATPAEALPAPAPAAPLEVSPGAKASFGGVVAGAPATPALNSGDTAWMEISAALVLLMTIPGLALFYGGMVRKKNVLATTMQAFVVTCLVTVLWMLVGYSLAFSWGGQFNPVIGGLNYLMLKGMTPAVVYNFAPNIPETVFMAFQMTFAIITPALIAGAFAERLKFSALLIFMSVWLILVYCPVAHWVWYSFDGKAEHSGWLFAAGALDFAGGTVVHLNAGIAGLVFALVLGPRKGYRSKGVSQSDALIPHNLVLSLIGASLLWVGWFGFNAGSATAANALSGSAWANTQIATAAAGLSWMFAEWVFKGKPSVLGIISGAVAGLVAITPASGFVALDGALAIGVLAGIVCYGSASYLKHWLGYDDSLDAFGVHGVGGFLGAILTGVFAVPAVNSLGAGLFAGHPVQVLIQLKACAIIAGYDALMTFAILMAIKYSLGLRVDQQAEQEGLDLALHGEQVQ